MWGPDTDVMVFVLWELGCNTDFVLSPWQLTVMQASQQSSSDLNTPNYFCWLEQIERRTATCYP